MTLPAGAEPVSGVPASDAGASGGVADAGRFFAGLRRPRRARSPRPGGSVLMAEPTSVTDGVNRNTRTSRRRIYARGVGTAQRPWCRMEGASDAIRVSHPKPYMRVSLQLRDADTEVVQCPSGRGDSVNRPDATDEQWEGLAEVVPLRSGSEWPSWPDHRALPEEEPGEEMRRFVVIRVQTFADAREVAEYLMAQIPVLLDLSSADATWPNASWTSPAESSSGSPAACTGSTPTSSSSRRSVPRSPSRRPVPYPDRRKALQP